MTTLEEIRDKPITITELSDHARLVYEYGINQVAAEFYRRGLCPHQSLDAEPDAEFCGRDSDPRSTLGHCTRHYEWGEG